MKCKFCGEELPEGTLICPGCGGDNETRPEQADTVEQAETVPAEDMELAGQPGAEEEVASFREVKKMKRIAIASGCVAVLAVLALVLFLGIRGFGDKKIDVKSWFDWEIFRDNDVFKQDSYTVSDSKAKSKADTVVATLGDAKLTNAQLQIYYQMQFVEFVSQYGNYMSYFGLDYTKPLDEQQCSLKEGYTWQQYFLEAALEVWRGNQALAMQAKENDFKLSGEYQKKLDSLETDLTATAKQNGFDSAEALLKDQCGINTTLADYRTYMETYFLGSMYFGQCYDNLEQPSNEALEAYFQANKEQLEESGIKQDGEYSVDVRHILVLIEKTAKEVPDPDGEKGEDGYTQAQWDACQAAAQAILDQWLKNPTEDNFAALANEKSHDKDGNVTDGGIYTKVVKGKMVKPFEDWCFDESRQVGDYGLVKTPYGYHVMFFSGSEPLWLTKTRTAYMQEQSRKLVDAALEKYALKISYGKIALAHVDMT